jgi:hypothetical protein
MQTAFHFLVAVLHVTSNFFRGDLIDGSLQDIVTGELLTTALLNQKKNCISSTFSSHNSTKISP